MSLGSTSNKELIEKIVVKRRMLKRELYKRDIEKWITEQVWTYDEKDMECPIKRLPLKDYLKKAIKEYLRPEQVTVITKSRQLMLSWLFSAISLHLAQYYPYRKVVLISKTKDDTHQLIDRIKFIYDHQQKWLQAMCPLDRRLKDMPMDGFYLQNASQIIGLAQGSDKIRSLVPSLAVLDEFAFQPEIAQTYKACLPCSKKIVLISTANTGYFEELTDKPSNEKTD